MLDFEYWILDFAYWIINFLNDLLKEILPQITQITEKIITHPLGYSPIEN
jgi:hypothetical protein